MSAPARFRTSVLLLANAVAIPAALKLREGASASDPWTMVLSIALAVLLASFFGTLVVMLLTRLKPVRLAILRAAWLEGAWILDTVQNDRLVASGLVTITYEGSDLKPVLTAFHQNGIRDGTPTTSVANAMLVRESDRLYLSHFSSDAAPNETSGVAVGRFRKLNSRVAASYDGHMYYFDGSAPYRQFGHKLPNKEVKKLQREHDNDWETQAITKYGGTAAPKSYTRVEAR